jgi:hypothetical protein
LKFITGNFQILRHAQKLAVVEFSTDIQFAIKFSMASLKINIAGQMHKINDLRKLEGHATMRCALLTGGLDLGNHVQ